MIPLLDIYPRKFKTLNQKDTRTLMFTGALFVTAKTWNKLSVHWWMNEENMIYLYINKRLLSHEKGMQSCHLEWMNRPWDIMLGEMNQTKKDKCHMTYLIRAIGKKKKKEDTQHNNNKLIDTEDRLGIARCGDAEWEKWVMGIKS